MKLIKKRIAIVPIKLFGLNFCQIGETVFYENEINEGQGFVYIDKIEDSVCPFVLTKKEFYQQTKSAPCDCLENHLNGPRMSGNFAVYSIDEKRVQVPFIKKDSSAAPTIFIDAKFCPFCGQEYDER